MKEYINGRRQFSNRAARYFVDTTVSYLRMIVMLQLHLFFLFFYCCVCLISVNSYFLSLQEQDASSHEESPKDFCSGSTIKRENE